MAPPTIPQNLRMAGKREGRATISRQGSPLTCFKEMPTCVRVPVMRRCLLEPTSAHAKAADLLAAAADALLSDDDKRAAAFLAQADLPAVHEHVLRLVSKMTPEVHRCIRRPVPLPKESRHPDRMPSQSVEWQIYARDGWRCRFCGIKVISRKARGVLVSRFPEETRWSAPEFERHAALYALASSLDHVVPHRRGGTNSADNFVTACYGCQFGRGEWSLEEVEVEDPRLHVPRIDYWDGLTRLE